MSISTANTPRSPDNCVHKIPTSCRLTATPTCCACQDKRDHTSSYQKYIDGVGFVNWGTRQERYCWPCKGVFNCLSASLPVMQVPFADEAEFWNARVEISGMRNSDTKIPERPNIERFLTSWYDWQRGYSIVRYNDGREERQNLVGEPLMDTSPGYLPRSTEELSSGMRPGEKEIIDRGGMVEQVPAPAPREGEGSDADSEFARLFESSDEENEEPPTTTTTAENTASSPSNTAVPHGNLAELAGDEPPRSAPVQNDSPSLPRQPRDDQADRAIGGRTRDSELVRPLRIAREHYQRVTSLRRELQRMRLGIERVMSGLQGLEIDVPDSREALDQIDRLSGRLSRYREARLEIPEMNNPEWQSPISTLFERAWQRHNQVQSDRNHAMSLQGSQPAGYGREVATTSGPESLLGAMPAIAGSDVPQASTNTIEGRLERLSLEDEPSLGLDAPGRPAPIENEEDLKILNSCDVCLQQLATVATFPCGHMIMCSWCADEVIPRHPAARNIPRNNNAKCPQCRRKVRHIYTVRVRALNESVAPRHRENQ